MRAQIVVILVAVTLACSVTACEPPSVPLSPEQATQVAQRKEIDAQEREREAEAEEQEATLRRNRFTVPEFLDEFKRGGFTQGQSLRVEGRVAIVSRESRVIEIESDDLWGSSNVECHLSPSVSDASYRRVVYGDWVSVDGLFAGRERTIFGLSDLQLHECTVNEHKERRP